MLINHYLRVGLSKGELMKSKLTIAVSAIIISSVIVFFSAKQMEVDQRGWEYKIVEYQGSETDQSMNLLGDQGWELVSMKGDHFYFKRQK